jgi:hypothetical protein
MMHMRVRSKANYLVASSGLWFSFRISIHASKTKVSKAHATRQLRRNSCGEVVARKNKLFFHALSSPP